MSFRYTLFLYSLKERMIATRRISIPHPAAVGDEIILDAGGGFASTVRVDRIVHNNFTAETCLCCGMIVPLKDEHEGSYGIFPFSLMIVSQIRKSSRWLLRESTGQDNFLTSERHTLGTEEYVRQLQDVPIG